MNQTAPTPMDADTLRHTGKMTLYARIRQLERDLAASAATIAALRGLIERRLGIDSPNVTWTKAETARSIAAWTEQVRAAPAMRRAIK